MNKCKIFFLVKPLLAMFSLLLSIALCASCAPVRKHPYFSVRLEMSPDGRYIALSKLDHTVSVFDIDKTEIIFHKDVTPVIATLCFSADSKKIFIILNREILVFDLEKKQIIKEFTFESPDAIFAMKMFRDGKRAVVGTGRGAIYIWNLETDEKQYLKQRDPRRLPSEVRMLDIHPDETKILSVMQDFNEPEDLLTGCVIWDAATLKPIKKLNLYDGIAKGWGRFTPDGKKVVTVNENGWSHVFDAATGNEIFGPRYRTRTNGKKVAFAKDKRGHRQPFLADPKTGEADLNQPVNDRDITTNDRGSSSGLGFVDNGKYFLKPWPYDYGGRGSIDVWDTAEYRSLKEFTTVSQFCAHAFASHPEKNIAVTGDADGSITVYQFDPKWLTFKKIWRPKPPKAGAITYINPVGNLGKSKEDIEKMEEALQKDNEYRRNYQWWNPTTWFRN